MNTTQKIQMLIDLYREQTEQHNEAAAEAVTRDARRWHTGKAEAYANCARDLEAITG